MLLATLAFAFAAIALAPSRAEAQARIPINIESTPPGATVHLDADTGPVVGTTPLRNVRIPVGNHTFIFKLANHEEARISVNVRRRRETFRAVLNPLGTLHITAGNSAAEGASIRIDNQPVGTVPFRQTVQPGRHMIQVGKSGFVTFSQWVELTGGQVYSLPVILEAEAPTTGSLLVAADISGVPVFIDGEPRGSAPTVIENIPVGRRTVELRPDGGEVRREVVIIEAGQRATLNVQLRASPASAGSLRVIANVPNAVVSLDGEVLGEAPVSREGVSAGEHILEATATGYQPVQQPVTVESGRQQVVSLRLERDAREAGDIIVRASVGSAIITVDGEERGNPPVVVDAPPAGTHAVVIVAEGYEDYRTTCETSPGRACNIDARLRPRGTPVRVVSNVRGAELFVNGESLGPVPYEGNLPIGQHRIEVRAAGYHAHVEQVSLVASAQSREFNIALAAEGDLSDEERAEQRQQREAEYTAAGTHAAAVLPPDLAVLDMALGFPYLAELRLNVGILDWLEGGFGVRTFGRLTEFEGRIKAAVRPLRQLSVGIQARVGGGLGPDQGTAIDEEWEEACLEGDTPTDAAFVAAGRPCPVTNDMTPMPAGTNVQTESHSTNSLFFSLDAIGTLHFSNAGAFSLWLGFDVISDSYHYLGSDSSCLLYSGYGEELVLATYRPAMSMMGEPTGSPTPANTLCSQRDDFVSLADAMAGNGVLPGGRQDVARARLGGALDLVLSRNWNVWALMEGVLAGDKRRVLGDLFDLGNEDTQLYFQLGLSYKF
jgi:hypothetical protein